MTNNFLITTIILCLLLIGIDVALYWWRRRKFGEGTSLLSMMENILAKVRLWMESKKTNQSASPSTPIDNTNLTGFASAESINQAKPEKSNDLAGSIQTTSVNIDVDENKATPAVFVEQPATVENPAAAITTSSPLLTEITEDENTNNQAKPGNITLINGEKTVHIQFTADIPEGATIHLTLQVVDGQGKIFSQERALPQGIAYQPAAIPADVVLRNQPALQENPNPIATTQRRPRLSNLGQFFTSQKQEILSRTKTVDFQVENLDRILLIAAIAIYALVIGLGINRYPIYFFTDEAIHMNLASDFLRDGFKNYYSEFLPTFFTTEGWVNGTSVYVQVLPFMIFGKSVVATRLVSAFISLLGAVAAGLLMRDTFKFKYYWAGIFLVVTTPAWFLHARTAFEYVEVGSFYSIFLYFYSRYRAGHMRSLYWAIIAGALTFYTHGLGQILMGVTGLALFIVDFRYHIHPERRKTVLYGLLLGLILLMPFARYYFAHPGESAAQVKRRGSYWVDDNLSFLEKLGQFFGQYIRGLSPIYWYWPNKIDLSRHIMYKYGNGLLITLPMVAIGLFQSIRNIGKPAYRMVLIALLACPIPASVVAIGMPRMLWMTIPLALLGMIGLAKIMEWVEARWNIRSTWTAIGLFAVLAGLSIFMLRDALVNGPTWFQDYSLYGMQYGAEQVFQDVVRTGLEKDPNRRYVVSPSWANGTEQFVAFFIPEELQPRISMGQPIDFIDTLKKNPTDLYFVATSDEYDKLTQSPEFKDIVVEQTLPFPNGKPGFYVITLKVSNNIEQIISAEKEVQRQPVDDNMNFNGQTIRVIHSPLGAGRMEDVFDNNPDSLARVLIANPFLIDLYPTTPVDTHSVTIQTGSLPDFTVTISLYAPGSTKPIIYTQTFKNLPPDPLVNISFDNGPALSGRITIEIRDNISGDESQIHVRTIQFK